MKLVDGPPWLKDTVDMLGVGPLLSALALSACLCLDAAVLICHCVHACRWVMMAKGREEEKGEDDDDDKGDRVSFSPIGAYTYRIPAHPGWMEEAPPPSSLRAAMSAHIRYIFC